MNNLYVSAAPHIRTKETISSLMSDVCIALVPAAVMGVYFFGLRALSVILTAVAASVLSEYIFNIVLKKQQTVGDFSAVVTGLLIGLNMPPSVPLWMVTAGSAFGIIIVKQLYGGLGKNFVNPALAARCFMLIAWTSAMTTFNAPADAVASATPLAVMKGAEGELPTLYNAFMGRIGGCIGETSAAALLIGFAYLIVRRVIRLDTPVSYIVSFAALTFIFGSDTLGMGRLTYTLMQLCTGGLLLGAFFMATDYVTTPTTPKGHIIFGIGCGVLTFLIRRFGGYPEGVSFSILLMNVASPIIENYTMPKTFGHSLRVEKGE